MKLETLATVVALALLPACGPKDAPVENYYNRSEAMDVAAPDSSGAAAEPEEGEESEAAATGDIPPPADVAAAPPDAQCTKSGLCSKRLQAGTGSEKPTAEDEVTVHYTGWTTDGKMFDSSLTRGEPATFPLDAVIPGWTEGVQLMVVGEKRRLWIPADLAYGNKPGRPAGMLVFDVELLSIGDAE